VLTLLVALGFFFFIWLDVGTRSPANRFGRELFDVLGVLALLYALLAGPLLTVDCLAKERREGTLGLLFLTDLRSYDVVLGKLFAAVFDMVLGVMVALPLAAIPMLLGGVALRDYGYLVLGVFNLLILSIAVGTLTSAIFDSVRTSLGFTLFVLLSITFGPIILFDGLLGVSLNSRAADYLYAFCPAYTFRQCIGGAFVGRSFGYWLNLAGIHSAAWACLLLACWKTWRAWREVPGTGLNEKWQRVLAPFSSRNPTQRRASRERLLGKNPVQWLESRDPLPGKLLWTVFLATSVFWFYKHLRNPARWPNEEILILWALFAHWVFCAWLAIQAPRRMADDKQSGALELLVCTAITPREIVRGSMRVLTLRFGSVLAAMLLFNVYAVCAYCVRHLSGMPSLSSFLSNDILELALCGAIVIPVQAYAFARVGLYHGLARGSSLRATWHLVLKLGVLPWVLFFMMGFGFEAYRRHANLRWSPDDLHVFGLWVLVHLGVCGFFLLSADYQLSRNFRHLAAQSAPVPVWVRVTTAAKALMRLLL
jgi:ABC-type transport system involved in cytochrome c biogenesis permease component